MSEQNVEDYIRHLSFKKRVIGGCDEEDVLLKMHQLSVLYREQINELQNQLELEKKQKNALEMNLTELQSNQNGCAQKSEQLSSLLNSTESAKEHILHGARGKDLQEAEQLDREIQLLKYRKDSLNLELTDTAKAIIQALNSVQEKMTSLQNQVAGLEFRETDDGNAE